MRNDEVFLTAAFSDHLRRNIVVLELLNPQHLITALDGMSSFMRDFDHG